MDSPRRSRAADIAAFVAIALSGALGVLWVFLIPIFQSPDEPAHFDYAASIFNAHRLVTRADGPSDWIVSPYTKYLLTASDFGRIAGHSPLRVAPGYGARAYYERLDASAPSVREQQPASSRINYIVRLYPFGFYALEALWMRAAAALTGSLAGVFFAARLLCVLLAMLALYFNYRTARNLGIGAWTSAALIAAIGFFPMTTLIASYVQPDNLTYALVSAALFFATELRREPFALKRAAPLGIALGLLAVTKYQFFLSAALPILLLAHVAARGASLRRKAGALVWLLLPAIALLCVQHFVVDAGTGVTQTTPGDISAAYLRSVAVQGIGPAFHYVVSSLGGAYTGCFISGICAAGYWGVLGWGDTPIVIVSPGFEIFLRAIIALLTLAASALLILRLCRNGAKLAAAAFGGHARAAVRIAAADPVINAYLCFAAFIFALYVMTNNVFGLSGRHWYPYVFPAFLCFVWYAPRALRRRHAALSAVLACVLLTYSLVAAPFAAIDAAHRYYGPEGGSYVAYRSPSTAAGDAYGAAWPLQDAQYIFAASHGEFAFDRGAKIAASGAAMQDRNAGAARVAMTLDGKTALDVLTRQYLFGIAEAVHSVTGGYSGFGAQVDTIRLAEGPHRIAAYAQTAPNGGYTNVNPVRLFFVTAHDGELSPSFVRQLQRLPQLRAVFAPMQTCRGVASSIGNDVATEQGTILLVRGSAAALPRDAFVWLLAGDRPFPAKRTAGNAFVATIPTTALVPGVSRVTLLTARDTAAATAQLGGFGLRVMHATRPAAFLASPPPECADPLRELAQS